MRFGRRKPRFTQEEIVVLKKYADKKLSSDELAKISEELKSVSSFVRTAASIQKKISQLSTTDRRKAPKVSSAVAVQEVVWLDKKQPQVDWRDCLKAAGETVQRHRKLSGSQDSAEIFVKTDTPIAVCYSSDWHLGSISTDHLTLANHIDYILKTDGLYLISNGDEVDNMQLFRNVSARAQSMSIREQGQVFSAIYNDLCASNKLLCAGYGNHSEEFEEKSVGYSYIAMIKSSRVPYFRGMGKLSLSVGSSSKTAQTYSHIISHDGKGSSQTNLLYGATRQAMMYLPDADLSVASHFHNPCYSYSFGHLVTEKNPALTYPTKPRIDIRTGTFKTGDPFSQRYFGQGRIGIPTVVFMPDRKEMLPFPTPEFAIDFIRAYKRS